MGTKGKTRLEYHLEEQMLAFSESTAVKMRVLILIKCRRKEVKVMLTKIQRI